MDSQLQMLTQAAQNLLREIDISTDCMSNEIKREHIDDQIGRLEAALKAVGELTHLPPRVVAVGYNDLSEADMAALIKQLDQPGQIIQTPAQFYPLRPEVLAFAMRMEQRLREKDAIKGESWRGMYPAKLMVHASSKAIRLESLVLSEAKPADYLRHAVDLANYCLMIASLATVDDAALEDSGPGWVGLDMAPAPEWQRDDEATYHTLLLVSGHTVSLDAVASWSDEQCQQAEQWAMAIHLQASDNDDVEVPRTPDCVRPFLVRP